QSDPRRQESFEEVGGGPSDGALLWTQRTPSNAHALEGPEMPKPDFDALTPRQKSVLMHIHDTVKDRGYPPSIREIGDAVGLQSTSSVAHQLRTLEKKGFLTRDPHKPRAVDVHGVPGQRTRARRAPAPEPVRPSGSAEPVYVPVLGRIAAGGPILAEQAVEEVFPLPSDLVGSG